MIEDGPTQPGIYTLETKTSSGDWVVFKSTPDFEVAYGWFEYSRANAAPESKGYRLCDGDGPVAEWTRGGLTA